MADEQKQSILVIDDDEDYVEDTVELLNMKGYKHVLSEINPVHALELVKNHNVVLILSDYRMPPMNGIVLLEKVNNLNLNRKIHKVICTGYSELEGIMDEMMRKGVIDDFIFKSPNTDMFLLIVKQCWERITKTVH